MSLRALVLLIVSALVIAFVAINWSAIAAPTALSLGFAEVHAPLGLVLLGLTMLLALVFIGIIAYMQTTVIVEARRHNKELAAQRELADNAEASRFTDLRAFLTTELGRLAEQGEAHSQAIHSRVDRLEVGLREVAPHDDIKQLAEMTERHNQEIHARVDRMEIGLRELDAQHAQERALPATPISESTQPPMPAEAATSLLGPASSAAPSTYNPNPPGSPLLPPRD